MIGRLSSRRFLLAFTGLLACFAVLGLLITAFAVTPDEIDELEDISALVQVQYGRSTFNRRTGELTTDVTVTNTSAQAIGVPVVWVIDSISTEGVSLTNADGLTNSGTPFIDLSSSVGPARRATGDSCGFRLFNCQDH